MGPGSITPRLQRQHQAKRGGGMVVGGVEWCVGAGLGRGGKTEDARGVCGSLGPGCRPLPRHRHKLGRRQKHYQTQSGLALRRGQGIF